VREGPVDLEDPVDLEGRNPRRGLTAGEPAHRGFQGAAVRVAGGADAH
jgi:hypothetical protein